MCSCVRVFVCWEGGKGVVWYGTSDAWRAERKSGNQLTLFDEEDELFGH
jgi:hypothetical protein